MKKILFFGTSTKACLTLKKIKKNKTLKIVGVVPRFKKDLKYFDKGMLARETKLLGYKLFKTYDINSKSFLHSIKKLKIDLICNYGHNQLFKPDLLKIPKYGCLNFHPGLLPYGRGSGAIVGEIINSKKLIGRTCHLMNDKFDSGVIIKQEAFSISKFKNLSEIENSLKKNAETFYLNSILKVFKKFKIKKINKFGTYYPKFSEGDNFINWNDSSDVIYKKIKSRLPGMTSICFVRSTLKKVNILGVEKAKEVKPYVFVNGQIIDKSKKGVLVKTADTAIWLTYVDYEGVKKIPTFKIGTCFQTVNISDFIKLLYKKR